MRSAKSPPAVWTYYWKNVWLWLLNNDSSLQGAGRGDRYHLNVVKSTKQKEGYQQWGWMWPLRKGMALQITLPETAAGNVCLATPLYLKWTGFQPRVGSSKLALHGWRWSSGKPRQLETSQPRRNALVRLWTQALELLRCLFLHFTHIFEHVVVQMQWIKRLCLCHYTMVKCNPSRRISPVLCMS